MKERLKLDHIEVKSFVTGNKTKGGLDTVILCTGAPIACLSLDRHTQCTLCCPIDP